MKMKQFFISEDNTKIRRILCLNYSGPNGIESYLIFQIQRTSAYK